MPFLIARCVCAAMLLSACGGADMGMRDPEQEKTRPPQTSGKIVCFGDSLTAGYGASSPGAEDKSRAYPAYMQKKITSTVVNEGYSGATSGDGLAMINKILEYNPAITVIEFGANDIPNGILPAQTKANILAIIDRLRPACGKFYIAKFYTPSIVGELSNNMGFGLTEPMLSLTVNAYETIFNELANEPGVTIVEDIWSGIWGETSKMSDPVHPNSAGYEKMADNYFDILRPYLESENLLK